VFALALAVAADKADKELREQVDAARTKAIKYLKANQGRDGDWEAFPVNVIGGQKGGPTALAALALLEAGVPATDPVVAKAVDYLAALKPERTYVVGLQTQVLARADPKKYAKEIQANVDWLLEKAIYKGDTLTGWSYPMNAIADNSNTHFAVMGLHAAARAGAKVDPDIWKKIRAFYADTQNNNGGWPYASVGDLPTSHSMSVVGLLGLAVAAKYDKQAQGPGPAFDKGMRALLDGKLGTFGDGKSGFYSWMATAELGRELGSREFKSGKLTKAWYREGAAQIVKGQQEDGALKYTGDRLMIDSKLPLITTAFGLYVLGPPEK
jgi:hypothetical protein